MKKLRDRNDLNSTVVTTEGFVMRKVGIDKIEFKFYCSNN